MKRHRLLVLAIATTSLLAAFAVGFELRTHALSEPVAAPRPAPLRTQVLDDLEAYYYRELPPTAYRAHTVAGMVHALGDPYTRYLPPAAYDQLRGAESGTYKGVGLALLRERGGLLVTASIAGLPGRAAGIRPGDVITTINGASLASLSYRRALDLIGGPVGQPVHLKVIRGRRPPRSLTLVRRSIALPYVSSRVVPYKGMHVCVIRLLSFPATAAAQVRQIAARAVRRHEAVILDLRGNPGGLLSQAVGVVRVFASSGVVVTTHGLHEPKRHFVANDTAVGKLRIAVLINGLTASAAEVVTGALRADAGAIVVGRRSYGKGTVQAIEPLAGGGALKLTVARFTLPGGVAVEHSGIRPDVYVPARYGPTDRVLQAALDALRRS
ncbi:MAG TPA: S41 family peptidase [Gaiellales bacterium]